MEPLVWIEQTTYALQVRRSTNWAKVAYMVTPTGIEPMSPPWKGDVLTAWPRGHKFGEPSATRTRDNLIKSQVLYHLS